MNLGFWEIVVIGLVLFILYGENFPNIARKIGKTFLQIKKMWEEETKNFQ
jgi:Sec-independent protein translocase protein TatA